jgi:hypothetical protein
MDIFNKLATEGSKFTYPANGAVATPYPDTYIPATNQLATQASPLHAANGSPGYSLDGANASVTSNLYNQYKDGVVNPLPNPSSLDLNGDPIKYEDGPLSGAPGF